LEENVDKLHEWFQGKHKILCLTGAGISTESGIPDYRGHNGSYHQGHKPMIHDEFIQKHEMRQRYWGRAMIGWRDFASAMPNEGHLALAQLEARGKIGLTFEDSEEFYRPHCENAELNWAFSPGYQKMTIITQNVDGLHIKAVGTGTGTGAGTGSSTSAGTSRGHISELHGRNDRLLCMTCGSHHCRHAFHDQLDSLNMDWLKQQQLEIKQADAEKQLRPDGDAFIQIEDYSGIEVPPCPNCILLGDDHDDDKLGFLKPDVVFFGDAVPKHRVNRCYAAVDAADGLLCKDRHWRSIRPIDSSNVPQPMGHPLLFSMLARPGLRSTVWRYRRLKVLLDRL